MRVVRAMPAWKPGKMRGKAVACKYTLPINFKLTGDHTASGGKPSSSDTPSDEVYMVVEEMPVFPGGQDALLKFVMENLRYPAEAKTKDIQGIVTASFVVGKDGKVSDVKVVRGINPELDAEAVRIINAMPKWKPGRDKNRDVACNTIPIKFRLQ
jgi:TonB family protein